MVLGTYAGAQQRNSRQTILIIEDEEALSSLLRDELSSLGYRIAEARDGQEGLACIQDVEPDLIICDRAMPLMTGTQLLERLQGAYPQYKNIPFIFLTALTGVEERTSVGHLEPFAYLEKPLNFNLLRQTIERAFIE